MLVRFARLFHIGAAFGFGWIASYFHEVAVSPILPMACVAGMFLCMWSSNELD